MYSLQVIDTRVALYFVIKLFAFMFISMIALIKI